MTLEDKKSIQTGVIQNLVLENREKLNVSGVLDVLSFDDQIVMVETELGLLTVKGENIRINKLSLDTSEIVVEGEIDSLTYSNKDLDKKDRWRIIRKNFQIKKVKINGKFSSNVILAFCFGWSNNRDTFRFF